MLRPPVLSEYDPATEGEGSVDPLGLQPGYERLADRILPAVTVRMGRPRYLTAIAVGAHVCSEWVDESYAADEVTPPWLVFEWFVIESFVRSRDKLVDTRGIPGIQKVENAVRNGRHVNAAAYLKTPAVFGYTGIFRRLARGTRVLGESGDLDDAGYELLAAWSKDQELAGFFNDQPGPGREFRESLRKAVREGMERGQTVYRTAEFWNALAARLEPGRVGKTERKVLLRLIEERCGEGEAVGALVAELKSRKRALEYPEEASFLRNLRRGPETLKTYLAAIDAYEAFCRPLTDSFLLMRHLSTAANGGAIGPDEFSRVSSAKKLKTALVAGVQAASSNEVLVKELPHLPTVLQRFEAVKTTQELFNTVLEHHEWVQREKPPDGKRAWVERSRGGKIIVRAAYGVDEEALTPRSPYVHDYRVPTFSRFLNDLGALS